MKKDIENTILVFIDEAQHGWGTLHPITDKCIIHFKWHEKTKRRDADNIASSKKFILDALVTAEILQDDSRKYVVGFTDEIIDDNSNFIEIEIQEITNG